MITITKVGSLVKIDGIEGKDNVYESISNFQGARMSADGTQLSLQIGEVNIDYKPLANFTIGGTVPTNAATVQSALATVFPSAAPATALPTEYPATYAAMQASITSDPTTKRDFFVSADETNGGVKTYYRYDGSTANKIITGTDLATKADLEHNHVLTDIVDYKTTMRQLFAGTMLSHTGDTTEWTAFTGTIPANSIGPNGTFLLTWELFGTSNANSKVARGRINGTAVFAFSFTTGVTFKGIGEIHNNNSLAAQVAMPVASQSMTYNTATSVTYATYTFDTTQDLTFTLHLQLGVATDTATIVSFKLMAIG